MSHRPLGVVAAITPYNFPTDIASIALAHIAAAGNCVVWKPSEYAAVSCAMLADVFAEAGLPPGVINLVQGKGEVGAALVDHTGVDGVFFTGSTATGRKIAEKCALRPHLLELGGDGPFIIMADADIDAAVDGAINGCFYYAGQVCTSAERVLVHDAVYDEFLAKFRAKASELRIGDPADESTQMGPLCNADTLARVRRHVEDARARGAKVEQFGREEGLYFPATILTDVTPEMEIMREETFGPVAPIYRFHDVREAIDIAHISGLGLIASLWTRDLATAWRVARGAAARVGQRQRDIELLGPARPVRRHRPVRRRARAQPVVPRHVHREEADRLRPRRRPDRPEGRRRLVIRPGPNRRDRAGAATAQPLACSSSISSRTARQLAAVVASTSMVPVRSAPRIDMALLGSDATAIVWPIRRRSSRLRPMTRPPSSSLR